METGRVLMFTQGFKIAYLINMCLKKTEIQFTPCRVNGTF